MKKLISIFIFAIMLLIPFAETTFGKKDAYYQAGDHFEYAGREILAVPNGREVELIEITRDDKFNKYQEFKTVGEPNNIMVKTDGGNYTAVVLEGSIIAAYDFNDLSNVRIKNKIGPYWQFSDFYYDIAPYMKDKFLTAGKEGISLWEIDGLQYKEKVYQGSSYGVAGYNYSIYAATEDGAVILNAEKKKIVDNHMQIGEHLHKPYVDRSGKGFFPGDDVLKSRTISSYKNWEHPSNSGNAVTGFQDDPYIYFVNGWNIYKMDKELNIVGQVNTSSESGNWSAGVTALELPQGRRLVVFNGSDILLFDEAPHLLDKYSYMPYANNNMPDKSMRVYPSKGEPGSPALVKGSGFWPGEEIELMFGGQRYLLEANNKGEAFKMAEVPDVLPGKINILMRGSKSGVEHSFWFIVE